MNLAARGARETEEGIEKIEEKEILQQVRRQAAWINKWTFILAAIVTVLSLLP